MFKKLCHPAARACIAVACGLAAFDASATTYNVAGKISYIENYGTQFTVLLSGATIAGNACGVPRDRFTVSQAVQGLDQYKVFVAQLMASYITGKTVTLTVNDAFCSGDRPTISYLGISD